MNQTDLMIFLSGKEQEAIIRTLAMMTYNPAIGRVLESGSVDKFSDLMVATLPKFYGLMDREKFEKIHAETCDQILTSFKTNKSETMSYGQAQKALNVFFKVYFDFAKLPKRDLAEKVAPLLHVPLDSLLMQFIAKEFPEQYTSRVKKLWERKAQFAAERLNENVGKISRMLLGEQFSLTAIDKEIYFAWQSFLRELYPPKPVYLDIIWVLERQKQRGAASGT